MAQAKIMTWNLGGYDLNRMEITGLAYLQFIASVMKRYEVDLIGFCGIKSNLGRPLGELVTKDLNNRERASTRWRYLSSPPLGRGRNEQYTFIWNSDKFLPHAPDGTTFWQWDYPKPSGQTGNYAFPLPYALSPYMPPFVIYFSLVGTSNYMPITVYHAPDWASPIQPGRTIRVACNTIAQIAAFDQGAGSLIMGTFNVPADDDASINGSNGAYAFSGLAGAQAKYTQALSNQPNRLGNDIAVAMTMEDAIVETADNFFFRTNGAANGIGFADADVANIFTDTFRHYNSLNGFWIKAPLGTPLATVEAAVLGADNIAAEADGSYVKMELTFAVYRLLFSDHLPIIGTLTY